MKINKIKINSYGKLKNKEINLENNLNIIYGKNESGKSTLLKFILNIFYGASKNKKGKDISDFEKYKPWDSEEYSGKLTYELDNKNKYEIYREFNKKNPNIYNENGEDILKEFNIDKNKGSEFFVEQTQINEEMLLATSIAMQSLVEGSVLFKTPTHPNEILKKGEMIQYNRTSQKIVRDTFLANLYKCPAKNEGFYFSNLPLNDIVKELEYYFDTRIIILDQKLGDSTYIAYFTNGETLDEILSNLNTDGQMSITRSQGVILITSAAP